MSLPIVLDPHVNGNAKIRRAGQADVAAICVLWKEFMDFHKVRDAHFSRSRAGPRNFSKFVAEQIKKKESCVLIAEHSGHAVGYCIAMVANYPPVFKRTKYGAISDLAVTGKCRRKKVGEKLVRRIEKWFLRRGLDRVELSVASANEVSNPFWRKMGYAPSMMRMFKEV